MRKNFVRVMLFGAFTLVTATSFVGCKDYDDDISNLQAQIDANKNAIETIKTKLDGGQWISKVESTSTGIKITLGSGTTYDITNGKDGNAGAAGKAGSVIVIGENGNWFIDGEDSGKAAVGTDGKYYVPNADGYWYLNGTEKTNLKWASTAEGAITAAVVDGQVYFHGVEGYPNGYCLSMNIGDLRSLVFEPEAIFDGTPAIEFSKITYRALKADGTFSNADASKVTNVTNTPIAIYHMNPSSVTQDMIQKDKLAFNWKTVKVLSRATTADPKAEFLGIENGRLKVKVSVNSEFLKGFNNGGTYSASMTDGKLDLVALQVPLTKKGNAADTIITSDYAAMYSSAYSEFGIAHTGKKINSLYPAVKPADGKYFYHTNNGAVFTEANYTDAKADTVLVYKNQAGIDLAGVVKTAAWLTSGSYVGDNVYDGVGADIDVAAMFGFTYKFEVVSTKLGTNTDQKDFVNLNGSVLTPKVYNETGKAAVGRTPIIKVSLMNGAEIVKVAFIKVEIIDETTITPSTTIDFSFDDVKVVCAGSVDYSVTVEDMNLKVYNKLGMSKDQFHSAYTFVPNNVAPNVGTVAANDPNAGSTSTEILKWTITPFDMWANLGKEISYTAKYALNSNPSSTVSVKFIAKVVGPNVAINLTPNVYTPFWDATSENFYQNVKVPAVGENVSTACSFSNILYSGFVTYQTTNGDQVAGNIDFSKAADYAKFKGVYDNMTVTYTFSDDNKKITSYGGVAATVTLDATKTILSVNGVQVAKIVNGNTIQIAEVSNVVDPVVKKLISTDAFYAILNTAGYACSDTSRKVTIGGNRATFNAKFVNPVIGKAISAGNFVDAVSGGSKVNLFKLLSLYDWRNAAFLDNSGNETYLFGYYGVDKNNIQIDGTVNIKAADGTGSEFVVNPANITLVSGEFIYKNEGNPLTKDHNLTIPLKIPHKWGTTTVTISALVKKAGN